MLYPNLEGKQFNHGYYKDKHIPLIKRRLGKSLIGAHIEKGLSGITPGTEPPFICAGHLIFNSVEEYRCAFGPHAEEIREDIPKYTDIQPIILISEIIE